jgi:hypothetical protein
MCLVVLMGFFSLGSADQSIRSAIQRECGDGSRRRLRSPVTAFWPSLTAIPPLLGSLDVLWGLMEASSEFNHLLGNAVQLLSPFLPKGQLRIQKRSSSVCAPKVGMPKLRFFQRLVADWQCEGVFCPFLRSEAPNYIGSSIDPFSLYF